MNQEVRFRPAIDLDELDRQLRREPRMDARGDSPDPLAELARIVGQTGERPPASPQVARPAQPHPHDHWLTERDGARAPVGEPGLRAGFPANDPPHALTEEEEHIFAEGLPIPVAPHAAPRRSLVNRRSLAIAAGVVVVVLGGLFTAFAMRGPVGTSRGKELPVIVAKSTPAKERPENPGGTEVPNQNAQIYERKPDDAGKKPNMVSNIEQPVDLSASVKRDAPRVILPGPDGKGAPAATSTAPAAFAPTQPAPPVPGSTPSATAPIVTSAVPTTLTPPPPVASNEPKRVKSVAIKANDIGELVAAAAGTPAPAPFAAPPISVPTPPSVARSAASTGAVTPAASTPSVSAARTPVSAPKVATRETPKDAAPAPVRPRPAPAPKAAAPEPQADTGADDDADGPLKLAPPPKTARSAAAAPASAGGWSIQLASRPTEGDARTAASQLGQKFSSALDGASPRVVSGAANGGTVYRVRVGASSKEKASQMCDAVKSAGGSCFISKT